MEDKQFISYQGITACCTVVVSFVCVSTENILKTPAST